MILYEQSRESGQDWVIRLITDMRMALLLGEWRAAMALKLANRGDATEAGSTGFGGKAAIL